MSAAELSEPCLDDSLRIVQLIPYTGPAFAGSSYFCPVAWALCADGKVRVVVLSIITGVAKVSEQENWWDV